MAAALSNPRAVRSDIRRLLREQYERAGDAIERRDVHRLRTSCKRAAGILRLIGRPGEHGELGAIDRRTRAVARSVGTMRDGQVLRATVERLAAGLPEVKVEEVIASLGLADQGRPGIETDWERLGAEVAWLASAASQVTVSNRPPWDQIAATYGRARKRMPAAADATAEALHRWRRHAKWHWYQIRVLRPLWPRVMRAWAAELHDLTEDLGRHHDLESVKARLRLGGHAWSDLLQEQAEQCQRWLAERAIRRGSRVFAASPEELIAWLKPLWKAWRRRA